MPGRRVGRGPPRWATTKPTVVCTLFLKHLIRIGKTVAMVEDSQVIPAPSLVRSNGTVTPMGQAKAHPTNSEHTTIHNGMLLVKLRHNMAQLAVPYHLLINNGRTVPRIAGLPMVVMSIIANMTRPIMVMEIPMGLDEGNDIP